MFKAKNVISSVSGIVINAKFYKAITRKSPVSILSLICILALLLCLGYARPGHAAQNSGGAQSSGKSQSPTQSSSNISPNASPTISPGVSLDVSTLAPALDAVLEKAIASQRLVGGVVLVAHNGKIVYSKAAGYADREHKQPMLENTIFRFASVSKAFTSMAAASLLQQGKLRLDDPVTKWLPEFTPKLPDGTQPVITVKHLLAHTAGLTYTAFEAEDGPYHKAGVSDGLENSGISFEENLKRLSSVPLLFEPGTSWQYSLATDVLGAVVAKASGLPLPEAMQELVTNPLGLKDTGFAVTDRSRLAVPYYNAKPSPLPMKDEEWVSASGMKFHYSPGRALDPQAYPSGGSGMVGTAPEVLKLLEVIRQGGAPLVDAGLIQEMNSNQISGRAAPGSGFGLGWSVLVDPAEGHTPQSAGTISWGGVYGHSWFVDPANNLSVLIMTNTAFEGIFGRTVHEVRDAVYASLK